MDDGTVKVERRERERYVAAIEDLRKAVAKADDLALSWVAAVADVRERQEPGAGEVPANGPIDPTYERALDLLARDFLATVDDWCKTTGSAVRHFWGDA